MSIGARSQSAKTYLETHFVDFEDCTSPSASSIADYGANDSEQATSPR